MSTKMELRPYQQEAKDSVFEQWEKVNKTLVVLPTGCGKTIVFAKVTEECVRRGKRVLILAHRGELLDQASDKIAKTTGLRCALEKAEATCLEAGTGSRLVRSSPFSGRNVWHSLTRIISERSSLMRHITASQMDTRRSFSTSQMQRSLG